MKVKLLLGIILILIACIGGFIYFKSSNKLPQEPLTVQKIPIPTGHYDLGDNSSMYHEASPYEIVVTDSGFKPNEVTIKVGDIVIFKNGDNTKHDIQSDPHPTHTSFKQLNLGILEGIDTKSLMFSKSGTYSYHDHLNPTNRGTIIVEK